MDLEKCNNADDKSSPVATTESVSSSEPSLESVVLKPREFDSKPSRDILPQKTGNRVTRWLNFRFFTTYRKIFSVIFTSNMIAFICFTAKAKGVPYSADVAVASSANLMMTLLFRQENFVNMLYEIAAAAPHSLPLSIRRRLAKVFHYGGGHSGCGTAAVVWFFLYTILITRDYVHKPSGGALASLITSYIPCTMLILILAAAYPRFRVMFHDYFEAAHRFAGWIALTTFWIHNGFVARMLAREEGIPVGLYFVRSPNFWFFCVSTSCTLLSWSRLRHREVFPEFLSDHAIRLHFKYRAMQPFYGIKLSVKPLLEWHAFATIPDEDENGKINGFSVVVSNAGDWTNKIIHDPPKKLWVRGYPMHGLLYTSRLFKRIVVVATGSGIGPCLSLLYANVTPRRVLWSTQHPEVTYGPKVLNAVLRSDPGAIVWNTRTLGRPDMVALTYKLVLESKAEAVFIISNPKLTARVVYGMETRGVPAYGAIFDS